MSVSIAEFAAREKIDLVVVGPEQPLVDGLADVMESQGVSVFGTFASSGEA
jgi:phosphoribosylamine--glycine ligase